MNHTKKKSPHCVFLLSERDIENFRDYTIHLSGMTKQKLDGHSHHIMNYSSIQFGSLLFNIKHSISNEQKTHSSIQLNKLLSKFVFITADKTEVLKNLPNTIIIGNCSDRSNEKKDVVVLMMATTATLHQH